jgi:hypothetical protein
MAAAAVGQLLLEPLEALGTAVLELRHQLLEPQ